MTPDAPKFEIQLTEQFGNITVDLIDFSWFAEYRDIIHNIMMVICTFLFIRRVIKRIPTLF